MNMAELISKALPLATQYAPYHKMTEFWRGFREYSQGNMNHNLTGVAAQAYARGCELAMVIKRRNL